MNLSSTIDQAESINVESSRQYNNEISPNMWGLGWIMVIIGIFMVFIGARMFLLKAKEKNDIIN